MLVMFYMNDFLFTNIETSCRTIQDIERSSVLVYPGLPNSCNTMFTFHYWYNVHNRKTSKILVFKVTWYHHELRCTLNSLVFEISFCLLFLKSIMTTLWVHSFGVVWIMISVPRSLTCAYGSSKNQWSITMRIHQFLWFTSDPLGSLILIQITPKKCTLYLYWTFC